MTGSISPQAVREFMARVRDATPDQAAHVPAPCAETAALRWREFGLRPGDLVLIALPNGLRVLEQFFGALLADAVPVMVAPHTPSGRLQDLVVTLGARALAATHMPRGIPGAEHHTVVDRVQIGVFAANGPPPANPGEVVLLTSGTSGFSSGCVFGIEQLLLNGARHADSVGLRNTDTMLVNLPLSFSFALVAQALGSFARGNPLIISGPPFHARSYLETLAAHRITVSALTPILARQLLHLHAPMPASLRVLSVGGDALTAEEVDQLLAYRPGGELYLTYGLTQAGPRVSTLAAHREPASRHGSVGLPLPGVRVSLEDTGDGSGQKQLIVASETVMRRRIGLVEGRLEPDCRAAGTVATGDIFEQDAGGYLYFRGRLSDFIVRRGEKICLAAVRRAAVELPHVVRALTPVTNRNEHTADFDLTLVIAGHPHLSTEEYRAHLAKLICRSEMPHSIRTVGESSAVGKYK
jgi:acyl-CoA synthetase (AMP-forming)/AMP-acid ligase II